ncbi:MAG: J domain-containing protein [Trueperaceae bacterium]|nr:MAG: J domain-containing protein [Trueperaceae bacterium]
MIVVSRATNNPYQTLGVPVDASAEEIKSAYRQLALKYHPDRNRGDKDAEDKFKEISEAYATLRDPESRRAYDTYGQAGDYRRPDFSQVDWQTIFSEANIDIQWDPRQGAPRTGNAVFDVLFGAFTGLMRNSGLLPGEDRQLTFVLPLRKARPGDQHRVRVPGPSVCPTCLGSGMTSAGAPCPTCYGRRVLAGGSDVIFTLPESFHSGQKLRLRGLGGPGSPPGDAIITIQLILPTESKLVGNDLHSTLYLTPLEASQGLRTVHHSTSLAIPKGTKDGDIIHQSNGPMGGDHIVTVRLSVWRGIWRRATNLLQNLTESTEE